MGNLLACFGKPKKDKRRTELAPERQQVAQEGCELLGQRRVNAADSDVGSGSRYETPQLILTSPKKKVKFDLNVQAYKPTHSCEELETPPEATELKFDEEEKKGEEYMIPRAYPLNHRYQNCTGSNYDDDEDIGDDGGEFEGDDDSEDEICDHKEDDDFDDGEDEIYRDKDEEPHGCEFEGDDDSEDEICDHKEDDDFDDGEDEIYRDKDEEPHGCEFEGDDDSEDEICDHKEDDDFDDGEDEIYRDKDEEPHGCEFEGDDDSEDEICDHKEDDDFDDGEDEIYRDKDEEPHGCEFEGDDDSEDEICDHKEDDDFDDGEDEIYRDKDEEPHGCDFDDDGEDNESVAKINEEKEEESYESYFSLIMNKEKDLQILAEVNSPLKPNFFPSPGENTDTIRHQTILDGKKNIVMLQGKVKASAVNDHHPSKENMDVEEELEIPTISKPNIMFQKHQKSCHAAAAATTSTTLRPIEPSTNDEVFSVDTSLSSWLTPPKRIPTSTTSPGTNSSYRSKSSASLDERPILGALTVEDLKKQSPSPSPRRKSPSKSPDEMPILGTVGSYWSHTNQEVDSRFSRCDHPVVVKGIPNTTSKYREDKRVNWHSTPFVVRLEKALKDGSTIVS